MFLVDCGGSSVSMTALLVEKLWLAKYLNVVQQGTTMDKIITSQLKGYCLENDRKLGSNIGGKRHLMDFHQPDSYLYSTICQECSKQHTYVLNDTEAERSINIFLLFHHKVH